MTTDRKYVEMYIVSAISFFILTECSGCCFTIATNTTAVLTTAFPVGKFNVSKCMIKIQQKLDAIVCRPCTLLLPPNGFRTNHRILKLLLVEHAFRSPQSVCQYTHTLCAHSSMYTPSETMGLIIMCAAQVLLAFLLADLHVTCSDRICFHS